jgi:hypothetical protein
MRTAVQLRADAVHCQLVATKPAAVESGPRGPVALFEPGEIVAYLIQSPSWRRLFVFRTLAATDRLADEVPGVRPGVVLLLSVRTRMRIGVVKDLLEEVEGRNVSLSHLSEGFYVRLSSLLGGRSVSDGQRARALLARALLEREPPSERARGRATRRGRS